MDEQAYKCSNKVIVQCLTSSDDNLINEVLKLSDVCSNNLSLKRTEIKALMCDGLINILIAKSDSGGQVLGYILFYSHYSTWVGESTVIKHVVTIQQNKSIAKQLVDETLNIGKKFGISRFDVFTDDKWLKQVLHELRFDNLSLKEEWDCYSLHV